MEIRKANNRELGRIKRLYLEAFPRSERKPFGLMRWKARQGQMEMLAILDGHELAGLAITVLCGDRVLLDYFAVEKSARGKGFGSQALRLLRERYDDRRFFLEIELPDEDAPNSVERRRRKQFYLKNGMQETGIRAVVFQVPMEVLSDGKPLTYEDYHDLYEKTIGPAFSRRVRAL
ncbi:MAG: GNAT family N-acetyltransferase [Eubacteriales bacterium]|nr:GNAT family N-acetyltransferase [Eubacteriales bacterium]